MIKYFATCPKGMETLLEEEIKKTNASGVKQTVAGVSFEGDAETGYRVTLWSRYASKVLRTIRTIDGSDDLSIYLGAVNIAWEEYFSVDQTFAIDFSGTTEEIVNTMYGAQKVKDAIVDRFHKKTGNRPSVSVKDPDIRIAAHLDRKSKKLSLSFDFSGTALHKRNYRALQGAAPMKENLAAAIVARTYAGQGGSILDPMCGSGTLLLEAGLMLSDTAPGLFREKYCFINLLDFDEPLWNNLLVEAENRRTKGLEAMREAGVMLYGYDKDEAMIRFASTNAVNAGLDEFTVFSARDLSNIVNPKPGEKFTIVTNPPYGERLGNSTELLSLYTQLGEAVKANFPKADFGVISSNMDLLGCLRMSAKREYKLYNGGLECKLKICEIKERLVDEAEKRAETAADVSKVAEDFANRLAKNLKTMKKWAGQFGLEAYRVYDADLPNYNAAIDIYGNHVVIQEYAAPSTVPLHVAHKRLMDLIMVTQRVIGVPGENVVVKSRQRQRGDEQYQKIDSKSETIMIQEFGAKYLVNLHDYLDTGLFCDHRFVRKMIREMSVGKRFLNLFAYTGTATVQAALGGAMSTVTVDMSNTYLKWAKENLLLNRVPSNRNHEFIHDDCLKWIARGQGEFDLIFIDPPTFSNSTRMEESFDVQRDYLGILEGLVKLLAPRGQIIFSNNKKNFKFDREAVESLGLMVEDIGKKTLSRDYEKRASTHNCWLLTRSER